MEEITLVTAIHHPTRRRIVDYLVLHEPAQVTAAARALDVQVGSVSHHLRVLQRAGVVEQAPDPNGDGRTSWWRMARTRFSWSPEDFTGTPSEAVQAREAERVNILTQLRKLRTWQERKQHDPRWARVAFTTDNLGWATPDELSELSELIGETVHRWKTAIDREDGQEREPVFIFSHGFPTEP